MILQSFQCTLRGRTAHNCILTRLRVNTEPCIFVEYKLPFRSISASVTIEFKYKCRRKFDTSLPGLFIFEKQVESYALLIAGDIVTHEPNKLQDQGNFFTELELN